MTTTFTFQYVSILIRTFALNTLPENGFTFQYVSILIRAELQDLRFEDFIYIPICFYFNPVSGRTGRGTKDIYIPICFYFNDVALKEWDHVKAHLHSNMFLF